MTDLVKYTADTGEVTLSKEIVKNYLVSGDKNKVTDQELTMFIQLCKYQGLNPFLKEAYLIKFGNDANMIVGKDVFTKRAKANPDFKGFDAGIIVGNSQGQVDFRSGTFYIKGQENLLGGYCNVYIKGWEMPLKHTVAFSEFVKATKTWKEMPATMIRKVALVQALREAFPEDFQGLYDSSEMGQDLPNDNVVIEEVRDLISDAQRKRMFALAGSNDKIVRETIENFGYTSTKEIERKYYEDICKDIETLVAAEAKREEAKADKSDKQEFTEMTDIDYDELVKNYESLDDEVEVVEE